MNHTLTAAVALAVGLGMAGIAQAQMNPPPGAQTHPMSQTPSGNYGTAPQTPETNSQMQQQVNVSPSQIQEAQQQLKAQGLYHGAIDGKMGPETQNAISQFQRKQGLPATAQLDQQTMSRLSGNQESGTSQTPMTPSTGTQSPTTQSPTTGTSTGTSSTTPGH